MEKKGKVKSNLDKKKHGLRKITFLALKLGLPIGEEKRRRERRRRRKFRYGIDVWNFGLDYLYGNIINLLLSKLG